MLRFWAVDIARWNHTAKQLHMLNMLLTLVAAFGGGKVDMLDEGAYHPYSTGTQSSPKGRITKENFHVLKMIGDSYVNHG